MKVRPSAHLGAARSLTLYLCITVCAQGPSELHFDAFVRPHYENDIELRATLNPCGLDVEIGRKLLRLFDACEKWSEHMT